MSITYELWCAYHSSLPRLVRALRSSIPEQYIGFYLDKIFRDQIEYQKQFDWLGRSSLDIYIPSLQLGIEYDGIYYHQNNQNDKQKNRLCQAHNIELFRIQEYDEEVKIRQRKNVILYCFDKDYNNIDMAILSLLSAINEKYKMMLSVDVDIRRDKEEILSYVQNKYYMKSIAYVWPESKDYWCEEDNGKTIFDVFYTDNGCYKLKCPHCGRKYQFNIKYFHHRKSLIPCQCELKGIDSAIQDAVLRYKETGDTIVFDNTLDKRRMHDVILSMIRYFGAQCTKEELNLYKESGIDSPWLDFYLSKQ